MNAQHTGLAAGRWREMSFLEQMANTGSEIERTIHWRLKGNSDYSQRAFERALELLDLSIQDSKNKNRLREIVRVREALADHFFFSNTYKTTDQSWHDYFFSFAYAAQAKRQSR
jgi:hypothetical protein